MASQQRHLLVAIVDLPAGRAWWLPEEDAILIDAQLTQAERRCALTHELVHRERGDTAQRDPYWRAKQESAVHIEVSHRLIDLEQLAAAMVWTRNEHELAEELWVDVDTVMTRIHGLTDDEWLYVNARIDALGEGA